MRAQEKADICVSLGSCTVGLGGRDSFREASLSFHLFYEAVFVSALLSIGGFGASLLPLLSVSLGILESQRCTSKSALYIGSGVEFSSSCLYSKHFQPLIHLVTPKMLGFLEQQNSLVFSTAPYLQCED